MLTQEAGLGGHRTLFTEPKSAGQTKLGAGTLWAGKKAAPAVAILLSPLWGVKNLLFCSLTRQTSTWETFSTVGILESLDPVTSFSSNCVPLTY